MKHNIYQSNYLKRLNYWLSLANEAQSKKDYNEWFHTLIILHRELSTVMTKKEQKRSLQVQKAIEKELTDFGSFLKKKKVYLLG